MRLKLCYAVVGVALGGLGVGWHGRPPDSVIVAAIRARSPSHAHATITLRTVERNWLHEIFGLSGSRFLVSASIIPPAGPAAQQCFGIEPGLAMTAVAFGPYASWRCDYPF